MIDLELIINGEELKKKLNLKDGSHGEKGEPGKDAPPVDEATLADRVAKTLETDLPSFGTSFRDGLELLHGDDRLDKKSVKGIEDIETEVDKLKKRPVGGGINRMLTDQLYLPIAGISKTITYNGDGTLASMTDTNGTKTMVWTNGVLTSLSGAGVYRNKTFTYTGGILTAVTVT